MKREPSRVERNLRDRFRSRHAAEEALRLEVVLLGDGRATPEYEKRLDLQERLLRHPFVSHVTIPEQLYEQYPQATADEIERSAIEQADVVICLEGPRHQPLGLFTEVVVYFDRSTPDKWFRCRPSHRAESAAPAPLVALLAEAILRRVDTFVYDPAEWETCGRITTACEERIELTAHRESDRRAHRS